MRSRTALVLAGGGARGAWQAGCLSVLHARGFAFDVVAGTSVGALNAALWCQGDAHRYRALWEQVGELPRVPLTKSEMRRPLRWLRGLLGAATRVTPVAALTGVLVHAAATRTLEKIEVVDHDALERLLTCEVDAVRLLAKGTPDLYVTVSTASPWRGLLGLALGRPVDASYVRVKDHSPEVVLRVLLASSAVPFVFPSVEIEHSKCIDGGVADNEPVEAAAQLGASRAVVIGAGSSTGLVHDARRSMDVLHLLSSEVPSDLESMLDFRPSTIDALFRRGVAYAEQQLGIVERFARDEAVHSNAVTHATAALDHVANDLDATEALIAKAVRTLSTNPRRG